METEILKRLSAQISEKNVKEGLSDLAKLHSGLCACIGLLDKAQIKLPHLWQEFYELIAIKFRLNVYSILELYSIQDDLPKNIIYHDLSSIYLLNRSLLETYLTFFYCYVLPKDDEEALMNYYIFNISGLTQRLAYGQEDPNGYDSEWQTNRDQDNQTILNYQTALNNLPSFIALPINAKQRKDLLAGKYAKRFSFIELIKMSPLKNLLFVDMWKLYSNYAHCELIGLLQISSYGNSPRNVDDALYGTLSNTLIVVSAMFKDFIPIFTGTAAENIDIPEFDEELITLVEFWYRLGTETKDLNN